MIRTHGLLGHHACVVLLLLLLLGGRVGGDGYGGCVEVVAVLQCGEAARSQALL